MTHNGAYHNPLIGGCWVLHQSTTFTTNSADANQVRIALPLSDNIVGFCLRIPWNSIESNTNQGSYNFQYLENALSVCREFDKKFSVRPISGRYTPSYIYDTLGARNYSVTGGRAPHPCNTNGTPNTIWLNRFLPFMEALFDWAATKGGDVPYVHGTHFSNQYSEFYHGTEVRSPNAGYDASNVNYINAHKQLWSGVYDIAVAHNIATEFGMSGTHVEDIQVAAVEYLHSISGDYSPLLVINANGTAGNVQGGTDWGQAQTESQQDANCGFAVNGVYNPPAARRVTRMNQAIDPGDFSANYYHNEALGLRSNKSEGIEQYIADGSQAQNGVPGRTFNGNNTAAFIFELDTWAAELVGSPPNNISAVVASTMAHMTQSAAGYRHQVASVAQTLPAFDQAATGIREPDADGAISQALPKFTQALTGARGDGEGAVAQTLPHLTQIVTATRANPTAGTGFVDQLLPAFTSASQAEFEPEEGEAVVASVLPALSQELNGAIHVEASTEASLPAMRQTASGSSATKQYIHPIGFFPITDGPGLLLPEAAPPRPEAISIGLFDRSGPPDPVGTGSAWGSLALPANYIKGFVCNVYWSDLQPDGQDQDFQSDAIDVAIQQAADLGVQLKVRLFFGEQAPDWAKAIAGGPMTLEVPNVTPVETFTCGKWWDPGFIGAVQSCLTQFFETYNPYVYPFGPLREMTIGEAMTRFVEPCIRQTAAENNRQTYEDNGYTLEFDLDAHHQYIAMHTEFDGVSAMAFNPFQVGTTHQNVPSISIALMEYVRDTLGLYGGLGNNSDRVATDWPTNNVAQIYSAITSHGVPSYIQTAAPARVGNVYETCLKAISYGCAMVELPSGYTQDGDLGLTPTQFDTVNAGLAANAAAAGFTE